MGKAVVSIETTEEHTLVAKETTADCSQVTLIFFLSLYT